MIAHPLQAFNANSRVSGVLLVFLALGGVLGNWILAPPWAGAVRDEIPIVTVLKSIETVQKGNGLIVTVETSDDITDFTSFTLDDPARIVFDLPNTRSPYLKEQTIPLDTEWVRRIRHYANSRRLRIVLETQESYLAAFTANRISGRLIISVGADTAGPSPEPVRMDAEPDPPPPPAKPPETPAARAGKPSADPAAGKKDFTQTDIPDPVLIIGDRLDSPDAEQPAEKFTLEKTVYAAIDANIGIRLSKEESEAAEALKKRQKTFFYPSLSTQYQYTRNDDKPNIGGFAVGSQDEYEFSASFRQPLFTGFGLINQYQIAGLGLDIAKFREKLARQDVILDAKAAYFNLLKAQKLVEVAEKTVEQIDAQREVAKNFYQVGMTPLNSFLQSQVELANAKQDLSIARNNLETAISDFNTLLRRPINAPVDLVDITAYTPFARSLEYCRQAAEKNRLELSVANLDIERAEKELNLTKRDFFPAVDLQGRYFRVGDEWNADGGDAIFDPEGWSIGAVASWEFWQWGRTGYGVLERKSRLKQAQLAKDHLLDQIRRQVKQAYLKNLESEINIVTVKTAIEQAEENLRINQERFKEQVSTSTDVLVAQTLLTQTMTNYYNALYDFKISEAALYRAMGQEVIP